MKVFKQYGQSSILALMILNLVFAGFAITAMAGDKDAAYRDAPPEQYGPPATPEQLEFAKNAEAKRTQEAAANGTAANGDKAEKKPDGDEECLGKGKTAQVVCNTMGMMGADPAQGAMMEMMMGQAMGMASQIQSAGANGAQQCSNQAKLSELMGGINAIKAAACLAAQQRCESTCEESTKKIKDGTDPKSTENKAKIAGNDKMFSTCKQYSVNAMMAAMQAMKFGGAMLQNQACAAALSATPINSAITGLTLPSGAADCSDPTMASSNVSCICAANPSATICGGATAGNQLGGVTGGGFGSMGPGSVARPYGDNTATDGVPVSGLGTPKAENGVTQAGGGGSGGGIGGGGGGSGGGPAGEDQGGGAPVDKQSMIGGVSNGGGGGSGTPGNPNGSGGAGGDKGFFDKFNLSKFLPSKKNFGSRGLAGMSVQSKDGITGPMGPSLWEKVTNQYQVQKPKMIQDR